MTRSEELYGRARSVIPGGVNSPVRAMRSIGRDPIFIERGAGAEIVDSDGNGYIDYVCSWGPLILGHADRGVLSAVEATIQKGTTFGAPTELEVQLAEAIAERVPIEIPASDDSRRYLRTKKEKLGHLLRSV